MKVLTFIILLFVVSVNSAEFSMSLGGKGNWTYNIDFPNGIENYGLWTSENTFTTNTYMYGSSVCSGGIHVKNKTEMYNQYVICKGKSQDGYFYISRHTNIKDMSVGLDDFEYIDGTGPWKELIGAKCTGAFLLMEENFYLWNAKCEVSDDTLKKINQFTIKKD